MENKPQAKESHVINFINNSFSKRKTINKGRSAYGLKHLIEKSINMYVPVEMLTKAMVDNGYNTESHLKSVYFNISEVEIKKLEKLNNQKYLSFNKMKKRFNALKNEN